MRYFKTRNATIPVTLGKSSIEFTPVQFVGGGWIGIYSTENGELAGQLVKARTVEEIHQLEFDQLKKKSLSQPTDFSGSQHLPESVLTKDAPVVENAEIPVVTGIQLKSVARPDSEPVSEPKRKGKRQV
jgi:hypothetical protein